tara:strand:- start:586 stop:792 length:207 start_codon:yes stop_codon:yes gene_type:complete
MSDVTTYQDLLNNDHDALVAECAALYPTRKPRQPRANQRSYDAMLAEYQAQLAATSINMINFSSTPWS